MNVKRMVRALTREAMIIGITAVVVLACLYAYNRLGPGRASRKNSPQVMEGPLLTVGSRVALGGVDFSRSPVSLILVTSPACHFCEGSLGFHSRLRAEAQSRQRPLYVVIPSLSTSDDYLKRIGVSRSAAIEWRDLRMRVPGTPTLAALDAEGIVRRVWIGKVPTEIETEILEIVRTPHLIASSDLIEERVSDGNKVAELRALLAENKAQLVIPTEREDAPSGKGAVIMPILEMSVRAPIELSRDKLQVVDCSNISSGQCDVAVERLSALKFQVATTGAGAFYQSCSTTRVR